MPIVLIHTSISLLLMACLAGMLSRMVKCPYAVALILTGLLAALGKVAPKVTLTHDAAFFIILPPILFLGGMRLDQGHLKRDWILTGLLAVPGIIISAVFIGYSLSFFWHIPLNYALLFGALISPTDPVSVLAILKKIKAPDRLRTILEAESLFNDGTGVVLYVVFLAMIQNNQPLNFTGALEQFLLVTVAGALIGASCGYLACKFNAITSNIWWHATSTALLIFGTPLVAQALHSSGIIAVVTAGMMMGRKQESGLSLKNRKTIETLLESVDLIMNSIVFLIIGIQLQAIVQNDLQGIKKLTLIGIVIVLISRALIVYPGIYLCNKTIKPAVPPRWDHILLWGGLRGTIPIILALQLPDFSLRPLFMTATCGIVIFSLIIQGLTIEPFLKKLELQNRS